MSHSLKLIYKDFGSCPIPSRQYRTFTYLAKGIHRLRGIAACYALYLLLVPIFVAFRSTAAAQPLGANNPGRITSAVSDILNPQTDYSLICVSDILVGK